jgi:four helix bundle protein
VLDHEKLDVYQLQLRFIQWVTVLIEEAQQQAPGKTAEVRKQLDRASLSVLLNIAEGNGKRQQRTRAKFFDDARGSTSESAACLDALVAKGVCPMPRIEEGKQMLHRVFAMLTKLVQRFEGNSSSSSSSSSSSTPSTTRRTTRTNENEANQTVGGSLH